MAKRILLLIAFTGTITLALKDYIYDGHLTGWSIVAITTAVTWIYQLPTKGHTPR